MSFEESPAFQFYPRDWLSDENVAAMSPEERGIYITLLCHCWMEGSIPVCCKRLANITGGTEESCRRVVQECFVEVGGNGEARFTHKRLERERTKQHEWREKSRLGGKRSGEVRRAKSKAAKGGSQMVRTKREPKRTLPSSSSSSSSNKSNSARTVSKIDLRRDGTLWTWDNITDDDVDSWEAAYPACNVEIELRRMIEWLKSNPAKAVKKNYRRFITNWLSRTQEKGGGGATKSNKAGISLENEKRIQELEAKIRNSAETLGEVSPTTVHYRRELEQLKESLWSQSG